VIQLPDLADIRRADRVQIADYVRRLASITNQVDALMGAAVSKVEAEGIKAVHQYSSSAAWLSDVALMAQALANRIVARAHAVNPSYTLDGTEIPAVAPLAGVAAREGAISPGHVEVIADKMAQIPATVSDDDRAGAEKILVDLAREVKPLEVSKAGDRLLDTLDPDGPEPKDPPQRPKRELSIREHRDGTMSFTGVLDNLAGAQFKATIDALSKPQSTKEARDPRSLWERQADALVDMTRLAMTVDDVPKHAGDRVHVAITVGFEALKSGIGAAMLDYGGTISIDDARMLACDCQVIPAVLGTDSEVLDFGRRTRTIPNGLRHFLVARDGGCTWPGCDRPPSYTEAHHREEWFKDQGETEPENLDLLCTHHHHKVHEGGWSMTIGEDPDRTPWFYPPDGRPPLHGHRRPLLRKPGETPRRM